MPLRRSVIPRLRNPAKIARQRHLHDQRTPPHHEFVPFLYSARQPTDPHFRYLLNSMYPETYLVCPPQAAEAILKKSLFNSVPRYLGTSVPNTLFHVTGFNESNLDRVIQHLAGFFTDRTRGFIWNFTWPFYTRPGSVNPHVTACLKDHARMKSILHSLRKSLPAHVPLSLFIPHVLSPDSHGQWPCIDDLMAYLSEWPRDSVGHLFIDCILKPHHHPSLAFLAVSKLKSRWPNLSIVLSTAHIHQLYVFQLLNSQIDPQCRAGGMLVDLNGILLHPSSSTSCWLDFANKSNASACSDYTRHSVLDWMAVIPQYAIYADLFFHKYKFPYRPLDLISALRQLLIRDRLNYHNRDQSCAHQSFINALEQALGEYNDNSIAFPRYPRPEGRKCPPGPIYHVIIHALVCFQKKRSRPFLRK